MTNVLNARSVLAILAKRPQPEITWLRQLKPGYKEPYYRVATFTGLYHRKFPLDYSKHFGRPAPDWIWFEHPETIIALCNLAMQKNRMLPANSPEPANLLIKLQQEIKTAVQELCHQSLQYPTRRPHSENQYLFGLCESMGLLGHNILRRIVQWDSRYTLNPDEALAKLCDEFGF